MNSNLLYAHWAEISLLTARVSIHPHIPFLANTPSIFLSVAWLMFFMTLLMFGMQLYESFTVFLNTVN